MLLSPPYGRQTIFANYTEEEILNAAKEKDLTTLDNIIIDILNMSADIHSVNHDTSLYLKGYLYGDQDIKNKQKYTREEINNKTVENWAWAIVDFKKTYLLGKPIQYVQLNDASEEEISKLNQYVRYENKKAKDMDLYMDVLTCGRGFRYTNKDPKSKEDEAPFELINCPEEDTEVVYSSKLGNEQLLSYIKTQNCYFRQVKTIENIEKKQERVNYDEYQVYLRNMVLTYNNRNGSLQRIGDPKPLLYDEHIITEYYLNKGRISLIELGKNLFDDINYLESLDKDDMEQFVNAIMVFTNAEVSEADLDDIKKMGAVCINSTDQKKASVELLQQRLNATDTQTYYNRLLTALHQILGVPIASDSGTVTSGDTGKAKLTGQGFTSAGIRAEGDETMFGMCDYNSLKVILKICKESKDSGISQLKASDIDSKFQRDMSDNLLVKTQALQTLYNCDIPRKFANSIVNLFGDSNAITTEQQKLFGDQVSQQSKGKNSSNSEDSNNLENPTLNEEDKVNNANNNIKKTEEKDNQGQ